ncbi:MAG: hypothetical protein KAJ12_06145, partial [Bacteroidetes bacterium]|nr:hypothetical protein [Bacteroidota bacterium]
NHPHDSICGCSIDTVHREMMTRFKSVEDLGLEVMEESLKHLVPFDDRASRDHRYLVLFNPSPFSRTEVTNADLSFYLQDVVVGLNPDVSVVPELPPVPGFVLLDSDGRDVPYQILRRAEGHDITKTRYNYPKQTSADTFSLLVDAHDIPPLGYKTLRVKRTERFPRYAPSVKAGKNFLENAHLRIEVNSRGEVRVKEKGSGMVCKGLNVFEDTGDVGDEYNYSYPLKDKTVRSNTTRAQVSLVEKGPLRAAIRIQTSMNIPCAASEDRKSRSKKTVSVRVTSIVSLTSYARAATFETTVVNTAKDHRLRVLFPTGIKTRVAHADSQFCVVARTQKRYDVRQFTIEHPARVAPMQRFVAVKNKRDAFVLFAYGLPEYELGADGRGTLALTLLRCVGLLAGEDLITRPGGRAGWHNETPDAQCLGTYTFRYAVLPCRAGEFDDRSRINEEAEKFHLPLLPVPRKNTEDLPAGKSYLELVPAALTISAIKESEEGRHLVVRVYNTTNETVEGVLRCGLHVERAWEARLDEQTVAETVVQSGDTVPIRVQPQGIKTIRLQTREGS